MSANETAYASLAATSAEIAERQLEEKRRARRAQEIPQWLEKNKRVLALLEALNLQEVKRLPGPVRREVAELGFGPSPILTQKALDFVYRAQEFVLSQKCGRAASADDDDDGDGQTGLTDAQLQVLGALRRERETSIAQIQLDHRIARSVGHILEVLQILGMVKRQPSGYWLLTAAGQRALVAAKEGSRG